MLFIWLLLLLLLLVARVYYSHVVDGFQWALYLSYMTYTFGLLCNLEFEKGTPYELGLKYIFLGNKFLNLYCSIG